MIRTVMALLLGMVLLAVPTAAQQGPDQPKKYTGAKISLDFQNAPVRQILRLIADVSKRNMVVGQEVEGEITLKLRNVPWDQALDIVLKMHGLGMEEEGNILRINTLENLAKQRDAESRARAGQLTAEPLVTRVIEVHYTTVDDLKTTIAAGGFLTERGQVNADKRTNTLIVKDIESNVDAVVTLVQRLDSPTPQVTIEARIVEIKPDFKFGLGIQWGGGYTKYDADSITRVQGAAPGATPAVFGEFAPTYAVNLPGTNTDLGGVGVSFGRLLGSPLSLDLRLAAGESQGLNKIISTPKITVLDNQKATIAQGDSIPYQSVDSQGNPTTNFTDATLSLEVTPHLTGDGMVSMKIKLSKDNASPSLATAAGPAIARRQAETNVLLRDGETTVIGGIYEHNENEGTQRIPFLARIPILGFLFKNKFRTENTSELLVFITPRIVK